MHEIPGPLLLFKHKKTFFTSAVWSLWKLNLAEEFKLSIENWELIKFLQQQQTPQQTQLQGLIEEVQRRLQGELVEELDQRRREQTKYNTQLRMFERLVEPQPQPDQTEPRPIDDATNPAETTACTSSATTASSVTTNADGCRG